MKPRIQIRHVVRLVAWTLIAAAGYALWHFEYYNVWPRGTGYAPLVRDEKLEAVLDETVDFDPQTLRPLVRDSQLTAGRLFAELSSRHGVAIQFSPDAGPLLGATPERFVFVSGRGLPFGDLLRAVTAQLHRDACLVTKNGVIHLCARDREAITRLYPLPGMLIARSSVDEQRFVRALSLAVSDVATLRIIPGGVVLTATPDEHRIVADLLRQLEALWASPDSTAPVSLWPHQAFDALAITEALDRRADILWRDAEPNVVDRDLVAKFGVAVLPESGGGRPVISFAGPSATLRSVLWESHGEDFDLGVSRQGVVSLYLGREPRHAKTIRLYPVSDVLRPEAGGNADKLIQTLNSQAWNRLRGREDPFGSDTHEWLTECGGVLVVRETAEYHAIAEELLQKLRAALSGKPAARSVSTRCLRLASQSPESPDWDPTVIGELLGASRDAVASFRDCLFVTGTAEMHARFDEIAAQLPAVTVAPTTFEPLPRIVVDDQRHVRFYPNADLLPGIDVVELETSVRQVVSFRDSAARVARWGGWLGVLGVSRSHFELEQVLQLLRSAEPSPTFELPEGQTLRRYSTARLRSGLQRRSTKQFGSPQYSGLRNLSVLLGDADLNVVEFGPWLVAVGSDESQAAIRAALRVLQGTVLADAAPPEPNDPHGVDLRPLWRKHPKLHEDQLSRLLSVLIDPCRRRQPRGTPPRIAICGNCLLVPNVGDNAAQADKAVTTLAELLGDFPWTFGADKTNSAWGNRLLAANDPGTKATLLSIAANSQSAPSEGFDWVAAVSRSLPRPLTSGSPDELVLAGCGRMSAELRKLVTHSAKIDAIGVDLLSHVAADFPQRATIVELFGVNVHMLPLLTQRLVAPEATDEELNWLCATLVAPRDFRFESWPLVRELKLPAERADIYRVLNPNWRPVPFFPRLEPETQRGDDDPFGD